MAENLTARRLSLDATDLGKDPTLGRGYHHHRSSKMDRSSETAIIMRQN